MTESQTAPESAAGLVETSRGLTPRSSRWRLPITYGAIASTALAVDLALILASATVAEAVYHKIPDAFEGEYSHTIAAAIFVAILFVATMRVQKLYSPNRLMVWDDQARSVYSRHLGDIRARDLLFHEKVLGKHEDLLNTRFSLKKLLEAKDIDEAARQRGMGEHNT